MATIHVDGKEYEVNGADNLYQNKANNIQLRYDDKQFHTTVIKDVLLWIEHNLQPTRPCRRGL